MLTVEYVDGSEGMESAIRATDERLRKLEQLTGTLQENVAGLVTAVNQQVKEIGQFIQSINRRVDRLYREISKAAGPRVPQAASAPGAQERVEVPPQYAQDPEHQKAWLLARVMVGDLEEYYGDMVTEGALYGNLAELLKEPIQEARKTYVERAPRKAVEQFDYFDLALKELVARRKKQLDEELDSQ